MARSCAELLDRCSFPRAGTDVVCAVSGGPDSMALLALAVGAGLRVTAAHVDHGLRPGSAREAEVVRAAAERFGAGFEALTATVDDGPNLEARARRARHRALPEGALLGHTMDDQAETVLLNLLRGAGSAGLAGMRADERRPLLGLRRVDTEQLCAALDLQVVRDPSNADPRFRRNRVRHELLPLMAEIADRDVVTVLARQAELLASESDLLDGLAAAVDVTDAAAVAAAPPPIARRALRAFIAGSTGAGHPPDAATVERALGVARVEAVATDLGRGWRLARSGGRLRIEAPDGRPGGEGPSDAQ